MKSLDQYVEVHVRIGQFWEKHPDGAIITDVQFPDDNTVRVKATVFREAGRTISATGHAEERRDQGMVNKTSAVENGETSAVGRALALMGFSIHKGVASREEVEIAQRKAKAQANGTEGVSVPQKGPERFVDYLRNAIQVHAPEELKDERIWQNMVAAASTKEKNAQLVKALNAQLVEVGGKPDAVKEMWQRHQAAKA